MGSEVRKKTKIVHVRLRPEELEWIEQHASQCQISKPAYIRQLTLGAVIKSKVDPQVVHDLAVLHAELNRVGRSLSEELSVDNQEKGLAEEDISILLNDLVIVSKKINKVITNS